MLKQKQKRLTLSIHRILQNFWKFLLNYYLHLKIIFPVACSHNLELKHYKDPEAPPTKRGKRKT